VTDRKIRFGVAVSFPESVQAWRDLAKKAEDLGYDVLHVADHLGRQLSPLLALVAAGDATSRIRLGTQVIANDFRPPVVLAKEVATLDVLSGGRYELGIGVGHPATSPTGRSDYGQLGVEMDEPGPRVNRLKETLQIIKRFYEAEEPFDYEGTFHNLHSVVPFPKPVQKPGPPIMVAGAGPRMLRLAAREANIINIAPRPPTVGPTARGSMGFGLDINGELDIIREAAGERYGALELCVYADRSVITDKPADEKAKLAAEFGIDVAKLDEMPHTAIGTPDEIADKFLRDRERYDVSYRIIQGAQMDAYAAVVKQISGN
jgi:probable F420-dependent oxidoreductase